MFLPGNLLHMSGTAIMLGVEKRQQGLVPPAPFFNLPQGEPMEHSSSEPWHGCELGVAHFPPWHCRSPVNKPCPTATLQVAGVARTSKDPSPLRTDRTVRQALDLLQKESCFYFVYETAYSCLYHGNYFVCCATITQTCSLVHTNCTGRTSYVS